MEKSVAQFTNKGMYQDVSISKATNEYAFENRNIRITALDNHTLFSITNEKDTKVVKTKDTNKDAVLIGTYLGHAILNSTIVVFTHSSNTNIDYIYKVVFEDDKAVVTELYHGNLNFDSNHLIQTLPYYESEEVQKVYWVDGNNPSRMINIKKTPKTYDASKGVDSQFDFNSNINKFPLVNITKEHKSIGLFPAGVIQYFITYYSKYGSESKIVWASDINYITDLNKGGSPDDVLTCSFKLDISNLDHNFTHIRLYSIKRTSYNGEVQANIVKDINIENNDSILVIDDNIKQESIDPTMLFFLGGDDFIASTITQKDGVLFLGDITTKSITISDELKNKLKNSIESKNSIQQSSLVTFSTKNIKAKSPHTYYDYEKQILESSNNIKTFKYGEIYRFALQFQNKQGFWTTPVWIGDLKCTTTPNYNEEGYYTVANAVCTLPEEIKNLCTDYSNYRLLIADTFLEQSIVAQGVVCPTVFNYAERNEEKIYAQPSWIMRPRGSNTAWRHLEYTSKEIQGTTSLPPISEDLALKDNGKPIIFDQRLIYLRPIQGHRCILTIKGFDSINKYKYEIHSECIDESNWVSTYAMLKILLLEKLNINIDNLTTLENFKKYAKTNSTASILGEKWESEDISNIEDVTGFSIPKIITNNVIPTDFAKYTHTVLDREDSSLKEDFQYNEKKNNYYVDNSILTFHSPDLENNKEVFKDGNLKFRIIGCVPITASYSDAEITLSKGLSEAANVTKKNIVNKINLSKETETLVSNTLYRDLNWIKKTEEGIPDYYVPGSNFVDYTVYMWNKQGSLIGAGENTFKVEGNTLDYIPAELKNKDFRIIVYI